MLIKRIQTRLGGKACQSLLRVQGKRVPGKRPAGRPAAGSPPPKSVVVCQTPANLSKLPPDLIELVENDCKGKASADPGAAATPSATSAARWSEDQAVRGILQVGAFDEDGLYGALEAAGSYRHI